MNGPYAEEYWKAAQIEIETLEKIKAWTVVPRTDDITNVLPSTWAFKVKRYPDGTIKKFKGRFCARGDKQIQGIDFGMYPGPLFKARRYHLCLSSRITWER